MNDNLILVRPAAGRRVAFARWGVAQDPKVYTVSPDTFAVQAGQFVEAPEELLLGALVDGHRYVSPTEASAPAPDLLGVATAEGFTTPARAVEVILNTDPGFVSSVMTAALLAVDLAAGNAAGDQEQREATAGDALPEVPASAYGPESTPLDPPGETGHGNLPDPTGSDSSDPAGDKPEGVFPCAGCDKEFTTDRGQQMHYRRMHADPTTED